ncbi:MAG: LysM peptidoglycan-binding domain-containing protein [Patescibacteria group bacterium]|nr:LysM peptidoglycan-binding domain-containing protein [Patescibacteria group bacterium]
MSVVNSTPRNSFQNKNVLFSYMDRGEGSNNGKTIIIRNIKNSEYIQDNEKRYVPIVKIASANSNILLDSNGNKEKTDALILENTSTETASFALFDGTSFIAPATYFDKSLSDNLKYGIMKYVVKSGDTPSSIATSFGISTYTVLWANKLKVGDYIRPKQELEILPVTGVKHIVKPGDTVEAITKKYKADKEEIIIFNSLNADGNFQEGTEGKTLIIPNGEMKAPVIIRKAPTPRTTTGTILSSSKYKTSGFVNPLKSHRFAYGHCTYYVASKIYVPWSGHAKSWLANARAYGYRTGNTPVAGAIVVTTENRWYGHVGLVESVTGNSITISEMNYAGWNRKSVRVISINSHVIRGYIYVR